MADRLLIGIEGLEDLQKALDQLGGRDAVNAMRSGAKAWGQVVKTRAKQLAPKRQGGMKRRNKADPTAPGFLKKSGIHVVMTKAAKARRQGKFNVHVGVGIGNTSDKRRRGFYGRFVELGEGNVRNRKPFLEPAFDSARSQGLQAMKQKTLEAIDKAWKKRTARAKKQLLRTVGIR